MTPPKATTYTIEKYGPKGWEVIFESNSPAETHQEWFTLNATTDGTAYRLTTPMYDT